MRKLFFILLLLVAINGMAQNYSIKKTSEFIILRNSEKQPIDSLWISLNIGSYNMFSSSVEKDTVRVYQLMRTTIPDNCGNYHIIQKTYSYQTGEFVLQNTVYLEFSNYGCRSYFDEKSVYCVHILDVKKAGKGICIYIQDTEDKKLTLKAKTTVFRDEIPLQTLKAKFEAFLLKPDCVSLTRVYGK